MAIKQRRNESGRWLQYVSNDERELTLPTFSKLSKEIDYLLESHSLLVQLMNNPKEEEELKESIRDHLAKTEKINE
jgi:hypothetical protein